MTLDLGMQTYQGILEQPAVLQRVLDHDQARVDAFKDLAEEVDQVVFTGCGSSFHLARCASEAFGQLTGRSTASMPASEVFLYPRSVLGNAERSLLVAISRSGETTEVLRALEAFRQRFSGVTLGLSCHPGTALFSRTDHGLALEHAAEPGLVMTRSFTALLMALQLWAASVARNGAFPQELSGIDAAAARVIDRHAGTLREVASFLEAREWVFLGAGPLHGMAREGALKAQEMAQQSAYALHPLELRHGPRSCIGPQSLVVLLRSEQGGEAEDDLMAELKGHGARILVLAAGAPAALAADAVVDVGPYSDLARSLLYAPALQLLAYHRAIARGVDPDRPPHLTPVVKLD